MPSPFERRPRNRESTAQSDDASSADSQAAAPRDNADELTVSRRRHLAATAGAGLLAPLAGCGSGGPGESDGTDRSPAQVRPPEDDDSASEDDPNPADELPLFDAHTHVIPMAARGNDALSAADLVDWMDANGIDRAVVLAFDSPEGYPVQAPSWWVLEEVAAYPDRLVPFCTIDPRTLTYGEDAVDVLERYVERGARGFGELKVGMAIDDERLDRVYELCADYELPILLHTDRQSLTDDVGLPGFEDVLASYPEVDFVAHATGWWAHVAADVESADLGGRPDGAVDSRGRVWELFESYDNVYGDLSTRAGWNALTRDSEHGRALLETHHDRLVFGSDYLYPGQEVPLLELFERFDLERDAWADVRHRTIEGLLR
ncbi:amidohydrolase family protein [Natronococcus occultus]|uniref:Putative TIM-barrel fold metal-dependent hydrolase n=1 Tax=Natronococcus occultus SP4 TaxID=694430 RepID=L0K4N8_9EURY|nr:amidohydrolase family protein [Natronococcus occultus]AGB39078.1 putative TIM-barrel fold metal-dependent hydrolase [Natronococcus occultus SP4]